MGLFLGEKSLALKNPMILFEKTVWRKELYLGKYFLWKVDNLFNKNWEKLFEKFHGFSFRKELNQKSHDFVKERGLC